MTKKYLVYVDDNFHYRDEEERYLKGEYDTLEEAISVAKKIVDEFLEDGYSEGMSSGALFSQYTGFGDDPWIWTGDGKVPFSAWTYAEARCKEICADRTT
jgi:hypothetical protein